MSPGDTRDLGRPARILSLDGGGIRGKSSLLILENIMERVRNLEGLNEVPRPCEYFDLIGGTSTGGIIATMLGRLGMTVDECIKAYDSVGQAAFTPKRRGIPLPARPNGAFSATALEGAIKQVIRENCPECTQGAKPCAHDDLPFRDKTCTKTVVLAITKANVDALPTLFTTYDTSADLQGCSIWQIARATSAATTFFKSIQLGRDRIEFIDAGFGYNNPTEVLIEEAEKQFPGQELRVLSIGTGLGSVVTIEDSRRSIIKALSKMASESTKVANRLDIKDNDRGHYYRFNVERGLDNVTLSDYEKASKIAGNTRNYLADKDRTIQKFVDSFFGNAGGRTETVPELDGLRKPVYHSLPFVRNRYFTGRDTVLENLQQKLFVQQECLRLAIVGLGGVGKTQVALQFAFWVKKNHPEHSVFWVSALSDTSFDQGYQDIGRKVKLSMGAEENPKAAVKEFLMSSVSGKWLLIIDNLDDGTSWRKIHKYLPQSEDGIVLFTTRSLGVATSAARRDIINLNQMDPEEAKELLRRSLTLQEQIDKEEATAMELLEKLTYLPLAIVQAAAYLNRTSNLSIRGYLELLNETDQGSVDLLSREFSDDTRYPESRNAVATTWLVSFEQIRRTDEGAARLLSFLSLIEPKAIPQSLLPHLGSKEKQIYSLGTLVGFAFLAKRGDDVSADDQNGPHDNFYDMHSLVHLSTSIWVKEKLSPEEVATNAIQHMETIFAWDANASQNIWRSYFPHAIRLLERSKALHVDTRFDLSELVGQRLGDDRQFKEAIKWYEDFRGWYQKMLEEDDPTRLESECRLAGFYISDQRSEDAILILKPAVDVFEKSLSEEDPTRLGSEHLLAMAYLENEKVKDGILIAEHVVEIRKKLPEEDPERIMSEHMLATLYIADGRIEDGIAILERVVGIEKKTLQEEDLSRLMSEDVLGNAYLEDGRVKDAIPILEHVVKMKGKTLRKEDTSRLTSMHTLARAYLEDGRCKDAIGLLEHLVGIEKGLYAKDDTGLLVLQYTLAQAYHEDRRFKDAIRLLEHVVSIRKGLYAKDNNSLLASQHTLARAYREDGRFKDAVGLLEHVVGIEKGLYAEDNWSRLISETWLGISYIDNERINDGIRLLEHVVGIEKGLYAEDDKSRLETQFWLGIAYIKDGRIKDGIGLLEHYIENGPQAEDDNSRLSTQRWLGRAYSEDGRIKDGIRLMEHFVERGPQAEDDGRRLETQGWLKEAYRARKG